MPSLPTSLTLTHHYWCVALACLVLLVAACGPAPVDEPEPDMGQTTVDMDVEVDEGPACKDDLELCGLGCVDLQTDKFNCGECGKECGFGAGCSDGDCFCLTGGDWCGKSSCVDLQTDTENCGKCGESCEWNEYCFEGECTVGGPIAEVLRETNEVRAQGYTCCEGPSKDNCTEQYYGPTGPLTINMLLNVAAEAHAVDMAERDFFAHTNPDGEGPGDRARAAGYEGPVGENIALGYDTAEQAVRGWLTSNTGHCSNLMSPDWSELGVGHFESTSSRHFWVQKFGR
jgi:hypothetical protein